MEHLLKQQTVANFVVIEGLDGSGTTTLTKILAQKARDCGVSCTETFEPSDSHIGKLIRTILKGNVLVTPDTLARLFTADRSEHLYGVGGMVDSAGANILVICDRYLFSSLAYQSIGCPFETVFALNAPFPIPELTIFVDVPPDICAARRAERDGIELFEHDDLQDSIVLNYSRAFTQYKKIRGSYLHD